MASKKIEDYALMYGLSNRKAKKALGSKGRSKHDHPHVTRGGPVAGTGKKCNAPGRK